MTIVELESACDAAEQAGLKTVQLVVAHQTSGRNVRLFGRTGPLSEDVACVTDNSTVAWWEISKLRKVVAAARLDPR